MNGQRGEHVLTVASAYGAFLHALDDAKPVDPPMAIPRAYLPHADARCAVRALARSPLIWLVVVLLPTLAYVWW